MTTIQEIINTRGVETLSDSQILTYLLGDTQQAEQQAIDLLSRYNNSLADIAHENISRLRMVEGIGLKRATQIKVAAELGRRTTSPSEVEQSKIVSSANIFDMFSSYFNTMKYEECWIVFLSASNRVMERYRVSQGGITATVVDHRLIIKRALELLSTQIIMVHNHPSGAAEPSIEDVELTKKVQQAAALFDIAIVDHVIVASTSHFSFRSKGLL